MLNLTFQGETSGWMKSDMRWSCRSRHRLIMGLRKKTNLAQEASFSYTGFQYLKILVCTINAWIWGQEYDNILNVLGLYILCHIFMLTCVHIGHRKIYSTLSSRRNGHVYTRQISFLQLKRILWISVMAYLVAVFIIYMVICIFLTWSIRSLIIPFHSPFGSWAP